MKFKFLYGVSALDLWKLTMYNLYRSMAGMCNIIFTVASILLMYSYWNSANLSVKILMFFGCCLFPLLQPGIIYWKAWKQVAGMPRVMELGFDDFGLYVTADGQDSEVKWKQVQGMIKGPRMIVIRIHGREGFLLPDRVTGEVKDIFLEYVNRRLRKV
ncbi:MULTISPECIES: YcxB family protein [Robinsoniella]|uniref:YcxB family protein n=1 Tax=Robinsoniella TaxID=588605 RepID=UPI00048103F9|nr:MULTISPECIES: YcxB family protein [Robinsoniella]